MKMEVKFFPASPLEERIHAGDVDGLIAVLRAMPRRERHAHQARTQLIKKQVRAAGWESDGKIAAWWGGKPSADQDHASGVAHFFCGGKQARVDEAYLYRQFYPHLDMLEPEALKSLAADVVEHWPSGFALVQRLVQDGLSARPDSEQYIIGLIGAIRRMRGKDDNGVLTAVAEDPALLEGPLMRIFEVEGTGETNLASVDKYSSGIHTWSYALLELVRTGKLGRAQLLERCLFTLERDWPQFRAGWFSRFHDALAPEAAEMAPLRERYLGLCHSRIPPTVALALSALAALQKAGQLDHAALFEALLPVMSSAVKGQIEAALKLLDRAVKDDPGLGCAASALARHALAHESPELHKKVIARLAAWGLDDATRADLAAVLPHVSASQRDALAALLGVTAVAIAPPADAANGLDTGVLAPLDASRKLAPLDDLDQLVHTIAHVFENETAIDDFERALEALARLSPSLPAAQQRFVPVLKRGAKLITSDRKVAAALARVLDAVFFGRHVTAALDRRSSDADLARRIADLTVAISAGKGLAPLSCASHQRGFIDPLVLCERIEAHQRAAAVATLDEQVRAVLRLPSGEAGQALARLRGLQQTPLVQACRYALGDEVDIGGEAPLFLAAARIRHPDQDDARVLLAFGNQGPDGAIAARYAWSCEAYGEDQVSHHIAVEVDPPPSHPDPSCIAIRRHGIGSNGYFSWGESNLLYAATILPSSLEAFFADGAFQIGYNTDWWEARWHDKAYLSVLMDRSVPVTPSAVKMIALALGGKEPGQNALAIDVFVALLLEQRIDARFVAREIRWFVLGKMGKNARYAKSLGKVARAHPAMPAVVVEVLCALLDCGDAAPAKDSGALLDLLLELVLAHALALPAGARDTIARLTLTGKAKASQKDLLARLP